MTDRSRSILTAPGPMCFAGDQCRGGQGKRGNGRVARQMPGAKAKVDTMAGNSKVEAAEAAALVVREDEDPWSEAELTGVRDLLNADSVRLREEIDDAEADIADLLRSGDTGGEDQADTGTKTFEREHEMSLAASHRDMLSQTARALGRIENGTYGICENCGNPIGKARLQAFPRATLCMTCKQKQERR
jgi:DnaK suppressor protein